MYKFLFGPVPSRRLGMSLGVDLVPQKVCSLDCIYCEVGHTTKLTLERKEYIPFKKVIKELENYFAANPEPDYITFSGSGEPTLNSRMGDVLQFIKKLTPHIPVAVLTNGTLLFNKTVRKELLAADVVLPSLDSAAKISFQKINRPVLQLSLEKYIQGLIDFRNKFTGEIWLEVLIIPEYNNGASDLTLLKKAIEKIKPDKVQLNTLDRPGQISNIHAASKKELNRIVDFFQMDNIEIVTSEITRKKVKSYRVDIENAILETIARRPCTLEDLSKFLGIHINEINKYLDVLDEKKKIVSNRQNRGIFYQVINH